MTGIPLTTELQELDAQMTRLGALVENALTQVLSALGMENRDKACAVVVGDTAIDDLHLAIQQHAFRTLIYHQPLAGRHLRYLTSLVPITNDLRISARALSFWWKARPTSMPLWPASKCSCRQYRRRTQARERRGGSGCGVGMGRRAR